MRLRSRVLLIGWTLLLTTQAFGQPLGEPDRGSPGDAMIQNSLARLAVEIQDSFSQDLKSLETWQANRPRYREEYFDMLGLSPIPERTPLKATVTGTLNGDGFIVDMLHYQSRPGLYVTGNLYRPAKVAAEEKLPAVFYVCGHSGRGRDGNKTAFQSHGMWFARHGYVCLVVDTLQLGEIAATHHGTYNLGRWWWHSRGYTPAGVECWNGVRGIDYLVSRPDVDPERIAVTGISGGGAATFWIAAADERVKVAVPVSGMADLVSYVPNRVINGHCDCMFLHNTYAWPWTRIAGLVAPRPLLFVNSDHDSIFPMDANDRVANQLERLYSLYGAGDRIDAVISVGGHAYRKDILEAVYRFINIHLKHDSRQVTDAEVDLVDDSPGKLSHPIPPAKLRVFRTDQDIPQDQLNTTIDQHFVPLAKVETPSAVEFAGWKKKLLGDLRRLSFRALPESVPASKHELVAGSSTVSRLETEPGVFVQWERHSQIEKPKRILLLVQSDGQEPKLPSWFQKIQKADDQVYRFEPRGVGSSRWTTKSPPNYVARSHVLLGRTVDGGRLFDVLAAVRTLKEIYPQIPITVSGEGRAAILAGYATAWDPDISGAVLQNPPGTHLEPAAPQFLNILRVADVPEVLGTIAPRPLRVISEDRRFQKTAAIYRAGDGGEKFQLNP